MEGGAHVLLEAVVSGTPVLASAIDGNIGMLGTDYSGYFPWNDVAALADMLVASRASQSAPDCADRLLDRLVAQCAQRAPLFAPASEGAAVRRLLEDLLAAP
jgi:hypothetical protein